MADAPIVYRFIATGQGSVESAFKSIEAAARSSSKAVEASARATEKARNASGGSRGASSAEDRRYKEVEKYAAKVEKEAKRAADAEIRERMRAANHVAAIRDRHFREEQRNADKAAARAARDDAMWKQRAESKFQRAKERTSAERMRTLTGMGKDAALAGVGIGASMLGVVGQAAREGVKLQDIAARLSINARGAGEKGVDATTLRREFENAAIANPGVKAEDVAAGAAGFVAKTGDLSAARRFSGTFATVASASGASVEDISNAAADLFQKFDITSIEDMQKALASLTMQGKAGAFEIKDAAAQFAKMSAAASRFGLSKGSEGVKVLGGLTQIARSATGSPEQAATAVEAMFRQLVGESGKLKGMGVDVFEKGSTSKTRDVRDVITDAIAKTGGSLPKLQKIFGEEGIRGVSPLISAFNEAKNGANGTDAEKTEAGVTALRAALAKAIDAPGDWAEIVQDSAAAQKTAGAQLDAAWESVKATVSKEAVPALLKLAPAISTLAETGIGPAIVVFTALVEAAGDVVDVFKTLGILKTKTVTPEERLKNAQADLDKYNKGLGIGVATPEQASERARLQAAIDQADKAAYTTTNVAKGDGGKNAQAFMTPEEFAIKYTNAANPDDLEDADKREAIRGKAAALAASLKRNPADAMASNDWLQGVSGENEDQKRARQAYQAEQTSAQSGGGAPGSTEDLKSAAAALKEAARWIQSGGVAGGGGSILGASTQ